MSAELEALSTRMRKAVEREMRAVLRADEPVPDVLHGMLHYHMGWRDADLLPVEIGGGKRIRPILCLLCCQASGMAWERALPAAASVELLHNFSLIHDDIEDASPTRRGRLTLWKIWGMEQAVNAGDAMFALAHLALNRLVGRNVDASIVVQAFSRLDETCVRLTQGQYADMAFETRDRVGVEEYVEMITGKTAELLSLSAELGALIAGKDPVTIEQYASFGRYLGLAFQVKDDILGIWGDESITGKSTATDVATRKKTMPVLYGLERSERLRDLYAGPESDDVFVDKAIHSLEELGAREYATAQATLYSECALNSLTAARPAEEAGSALYQLSDMLLRRDS